MEIAGDITNSTNPTDNTDKQALLAVLQFLRKNNLQGTEQLLRREANLGDTFVSPTVTPQADDVSQALSAYRSENKPSIYDDIYRDLANFIETSLDIHKVELSLILYPVFVHMYLELVYNDHELHAQVFFGEFSGGQESYYQEDLQQLATVTKKEHMQGNQLMDNFRSSKFVIRMSRESNTHLKRHLQEKKHRLLLNIIDEHLLIDLFDGAPRTKTQVDASSGGLLGEVVKSANKSKVYYGLLKEPDFNIPLDDEDEGEQTEDKPKKKKSKKDPLLMKKSKSDPNAPSNNRIPLPEMKDVDKIDRINFYRESMKRVKLGPTTQPSICFYTFLNGYHEVTCIEFTEDSSLIAAGFSNSSIRIWSLTPNRLRTVKGPTDLSIIDIEADDVLERMMDDRSASESRLLVGHSGPVYSTSFSPDKHYLISGSEDGTIRLWSLKTWTNLVVYKGHNYPVWSVQFSPHGHYFVSGGHDRTARIWSTDHYQPLRIFAGHLSDVDCVQFHPNSNYVATGCSDRLVRLYDMLNGKCVRQMSGHKGAIQCLRFSPDGRYLASAGADKTVLLWDLANGNQIGQLRGHTNTVYSLCFSREGAVLASGGIDDQVLLWDVAKVFEEQDSDTAPGTATVANITGEDTKLLIGSQKTKNSPVLDLHFTRRNLLLASGPFMGKRS